MFWKMQNSATSCWWVWLSLGMPQAFCPKMLSYQRLRDWPFTKVELNFLSKLMSAFCLNLNPSWQCCVFPICVCNTCHLIIWWLQESQNQNLATETLCMEHPYKWTLSWFPSFVVPFVTFCCNRHDWFCLLQSLWLYLSWPCKPLAHARTHWDTRLTNSDYRGPWCLTSCDSNSAVSKIKRLTLYVHVPMTCLQYCLYD